MSDAVAITELPFAQQVHEYARHLTRSLPNPTDANAVKDFLSPFEAQVNGLEESSDAAAGHQEIVRDLVERTVEMKGGLEAARETEGESCHMLLQYLVATTFDPSSPEYAELCQKLIGSITEAAQSAASSSRMSRVETVCRILNDVYNFLPPTSPLRPTALLALLKLLAETNELSAMPITATQLQSALSSWNIPLSEKASFLAQISNTYASAGMFDKAVESQLLALQHDSSSSSADRVVAIALADDKRLQLDDVLALDGVREGLKGEMAGLVGIYQDADELEAVAKGKEWLSAHAVWIDSLGIEKLTTNAILRKLRLIALATLAARSTTQQLSFSEISKSLSIPETKVEVWVIDGIRASLFQARISQPTATVRIISVSSQGTRSFGTSEWQLLERRLESWKSVVAGAREVVANAEELASHGPITNRTRAHAQDTKRDEVTA